MLGVEKKGYILAAEVRQFMPAGQIAAHDRCLVFFFQLQRVRSKLTHELKVVILHFFGKFTCAKKFE